MTAVIVVCTGNVCRSPIAEGLMRRATEHRTVRSSDHRCRPPGRPAGRGRPRCRKRSRPPPNAGSTSPATWRRGSDRACRPSPTSCSAWRRSTGTQIASDEPQAGRQDLHVEGARPAPRGRCAAAAATPAARIAAAAAARAGAEAGEHQDEDIVDPLGLPLDGYRAIAWELRRLDRSGSCPRSSIRCPRSSPGEH